MPGYHESSVLPPWAPRRHRTPDMRSPLAILAAVLLAATGRAEPIPTDPTAEPVPAYVGAPATPRRVHAPAVPAHPFMAPNGRSNIHDDAYQTDTYVGGGPLGRNPEVLSTLLAAECASLTVDSAGRIVTICVGLEGPDLFLLDARTLDTLAVLPLPPRSGSGGGSVFSDFSGGGYFYLDQLDRAVIPTNDHQIRVVGETISPAGPAFTLAEVHDLSTVVAVGDGIISALPDWSGRLWFVTVNGLVGTIDPESDAVQTVQLAGEAIGNSFAVDETGGVFIVSDHALYRFDAGPGAAPAVTWREEYDRGTRLKPGQTNFGSGTTPTLMGSRWVAITDNADPQMHVLVYWRAPTTTHPRLLCSTPVFADGTSATENSLIGTGNALLVENNYGYSGLTAVMNGATTEPGISRIDVRATGRCRTRWTSQERVPSTVSKLSLADGIMYAYTKDPGPGSTDAWYLTAVGFRTGATLWKRLVGTGFGYNNNFAPVTLGPDGTAYVGVLGGLTLIRDAP
jgi:hypothetical protein